MRHIALFASTLLLGACQMSGGGEAPTDSTSEALDSMPLDAVHDSMRRPPVLHWTSEDDQLIAPIWTGNDDKGSVYLPEYRGASVGIEDYVFAPPSGDCRNLKG